MKKISFVTAFFWFVTYAFYSQPTYSMNDEIEPREKKRKMEVQTVSSAQPETGDDVFIIESEKLLKDFTQIHNDNNQKNKYQLYTHSTPFWFFRAK